MWPLRPTSRGFSYSPALDRGGFVAVRQTNAPEDILVVVQFDDRCPQRHNHKDHEDPVFNAFPLRPFVSFVL